MISLDVISRSLTAMCIKRRRIKIKKRKINESVIIVIIINYFSALTRMCVIMYKQQ